MAQRKLVGAVGIGGQVYRAGQEKEAEAAAGKAGVDLQSPRFAAAYGDPAPSSDSFNAAGANRDELEAEAERRGLEVEGSGKDGYVTMDDYRTALG